MLLPQWNIWVPFKGTTPVTAFLHSELPQWELITHMDTHRFWHRAASVSMWERNPESIKKASVTRGRLKIYSPGEKRNAIQSPLISLIFSQHDYSNHCLSSSNPTPKYPSLRSLCNCSILLSWKQNCFTPSASQVCISCPLKQNISGLFTGKVMMLSSFLFIILVHLFHNLIWLFKAC